MIQPIPSKPWAKIKSKVCRDCKQDKSVAYFQRTASLGYMPRCKECQKNYRLELNKKKLMSRITDFPVDK